MAKELRLKIRTCRYLLLPCNWECIRPNVKRSRVDSIDQMSAGYFFY
uniref:Uncharacterized protein n=1 Tax=Utricularia reniformis TaxID=192314 RepID=A0A1Y0B155_9LAMI|nr:hypothetical protein AEK19_MT0924 [Utricularia reniformis]ART31150.1 hypothetical protein AEK19_MT0924 [Utricularia reniformis]